ncbi:phosphoribosyltransferase [Candidatus Woesebacteria bacterium]|nr:phosphoribosyltransferase [Candidatus Woesebacteria bacterium]
MFKNREEAALKLAQKLSSYKKRTDVLVLGIPRGGVITGYVLTKMLKVSFGVLVIRKIGAPSQSELAIGAVGPGGVVILDKDLIKRLRVEPGWLKEEIKKKKIEVDERITRFGSGKKYDFKGKAVILTDDGIATGATIEAAIKCLRKVGVKEIILAVPVAPSDTASRLGKMVGKIVILEIPKLFSAVGQFYREFPQVADAEVIQLLQ